MTTYTLIKQEQQCMVEECAKQIRKQRGLPDGAPVAVCIYCNCPKCNPMC